MKEYKREDVEVCTPSVESSCKDVVLKNDVLMEEEQCFQIKRTECKEEINEFKNEVCGYEYETRTENAFITAVKVDYNRRDKVENVRKCKYSYYGKKQCQNTKQKVKKNVPEVHTAMKSIPISFPEAVKKCISKRIL